MRTLGLDVGEKRLGVAISDSMGLMAVPHSVINLTGDLETDLNSVADIVRESLVELVVVGFPVNLKSQISHAAKKAQDYVKLLEQKLEVSVVLQDERLSSVEAQKKLKLAGVSSKKARQKVDMAAATIILQSWLDTQSKGNSQSKDNSSKTADTLSASES